MATIGDARALLVNAAQMLLYSSDDCLYRSRD